MKLLFYKSLVLFLAFTGIVLGQKHTVLNKSFDVGSAKVLELDLKNIPLTILPSLDNKIHVDFTMDFKGFTEQEIKAKLNKVYFEKAISSNDIKLYIKSETTISPSHFFSTKGIVIDNTKDFVSLSSKIGEKKDKRKSKADIINEIRVTPLEEESFLSQITKQIENDKDAQVQEARFFIRVPKKLQLKIKAQGVRLTSEIAESKNLKLEMNGSSFKARKLSNATISIKNAYLKIEAIENGIIDLIDMENCLIGSVYNSQIKSETSKIEIGEIQKNVNIKDFDGEYFLYNFIKDYKDFNFDGDYSKVHYYKPDFNITAKVYGYNSVLKDGDISGKVGLTKERKKDLMFVIHSKKENNNAESIRFDLIDGIFYLNSTPNKNN